MLDLPGRSVLACRELPWPAGPLAAFERLREDPYPWLLDSALSGGRIGRFSFAGADPYAVLRARGTRVEIECRRAVRPGLRPGRTAADGDPLEWLRSLLPPRPSAACDVPFPFAGGAVGYLGYELAECIEPVGLRGRDDLGLPDLVLLFVDRLLAFDHGQGRLCAIGLGFGENERLARAAAARASEGLCRRILAPPLSRRVSRARRAAEPRCGAAPLDVVDRSTYLKAVDRAKEEIEAGNAYQVCLTHRIGREAHADPWSLYRRVRRSNPAPFASYFELPEVAIVGSSPERFLRLVADRRVESRPIKGTRPRGRHEAEDALLRRELELSGKDRAENVMIVDLVRNDLGRVCETGSVEVSELFAVEAYASVFQMVSTIRGRLRADRDVVDLLRATFPPGSMTGAPKLAAMRILDGLEPVRRGVYSGAIGYLDARGGADLCVVIRTILLAGGRAYVHTGGGVVADSDPVAEWRETLDKARPLLAALTAG
ncbi:MAG: aminodeoxychorismate synthase component I [Myxococcales bacterium]|nr:aminodeoxychorismate synthase component I [Myxococcales bacterium]